MSAFSGRHEARPRLRVRMEAEMWRVKKEKVWKDCPGKWEGDHVERRQCGLQAALRAPLRPTVVNSKARHSAGRVLSPATFSHTDAGTESTDRFNQGQVVPREAGN